VRPRAELAAQVEAVTGAQVRDAFARMLAAGAAVAVAGKVRKGADEGFLGLVTGRSSGRGFDHRSAKHSSRTPNRSG